MIQSPGPLPRLALTLNSGPFPPPALHRLRRSYGPVRHPQRPGLTLAGLRLGALPPTAEDFPCRAVLSIHTCRRQYPGGASGCLCRSLPLMCQPSPRFPTGSASALLFSGSTQRSLPVAARVFAKPPKVALYTEGSDRFVTSTTTPIATGWSRQLPGGSISH